MSDLEKGILFTVFISQLGFLIYTIRFILKFQNFLPNINALQVTTIYLSKTDILKTSLYSELQSYEIRKEGAESYKVLVSKASTILFESLLSSINQYSIKRKSVSIEYNYIKDLVDGYVEQIKERIHTLLPSTLYLGLIGTVVGIVVGFYTLSENSEDIKISSLLHSVKHAMSVSGFGLLFYFILNTLFYVTIRSYHLNERVFLDYIYLNFCNDSQQNEFPIGTTASLENSIQKLERAIDSHTNKFSLDIDKLDSVVKNNMSIVQGQQENLNAQKELLKYIEEKKINDIIESSVKVFEKLNGSLENFGSFSNQIESIHISLDGLTKYFDELDNNKKSIGNIILEINKAISSSLNSFTELIYSQQNQLSKAISGIEEQIHQSMNSIQNSVDSDTKNFEQFLSNRLNNLRKVTNEMEGEFQNIIVLLNSQIKKFIEEHYDKLMLDLRPKTKEYNSALEKLNKGIEKSLSGFDSLLSKEMNYIEQSQKSIEGLNNYFQKLSENQYELVRTVNTTNESIKNVMNSMEDTVKGQTDKLTRAAMGMETHFNNTMDKLQEAMNKDNESLAKFLMDRTKELEKVAQASESDLASIITEIDKNIKDTVKQHYERMMEEFTPKSDEYNKQLKQLQEDIKVFLTQTGLLLSTEKEQLKGLIEDRKNINQTQKEIEDKLSKNIEKLISIHKEELDILREISKKEVTNGDSSIIDKIKNTFTKKRF